MRKRCLRATALAAALVVLGAASALAGTVPANVPKSKSVAAVQTVPPVSNFGGGDSIMRPPLPIAQAPAAPTPQAVPGNFAIWARCWNPTPLIWLSFDDGGSAVEVNAIIDYLLAHNLKAWFFPTGQWAAANPWLIVRMLWNGMKIGNHSYSHPFLTTLSNAGVLYQIDHGVGQGLMRPPFGDGIAPRSDRVLSLISSRGFLPCFWSVDTRDWQSLSVAQMMVNVRLQLAPGGMILMHMHGLNTVALLPFISQYVASRGWKLVPLH